VCERDSKLTNRKSTGKRRRINRKDGRRKKRVKRRRRKGAEGWGRREVKGKEAMSTFCYVIVSIDLPRYWLSREYRKIELIEQGSVITVYLKLYAEFQWSARGNWGDLGPWCEIRGDRR
jgi:hypothetical protein